ncbi:hypothetical protein U1Q18_010108 [Sarracenia purpurea var. burkii]
MQGTMAAKSSTHGSASTGKEQGASGEGRNYRPEAARVAHVTDDALRRRRRWADGSAPLRRCRGKLLWVAVWGLPTGTSTPEVEVSPVMVGVDERHLERKREIAPGGAGAKQRAEQGGGRSCGIASKARL